jgi:hypothetical protein
MKTNPSLLVTLLAAVALGATLPVRAADTTTKSLDALKTGKGQIAPAKTPATPEPPPTIDGIVLNRSNGGFLGLTLVNSNFKLSFYDAKKKPADVDVTRATARWPVKYKLGDEHTVLNPTADGKALTSTWHVRPPYVFKLYVSLFIQGQENAVESYVIDFHL